MNLLQIILLLLTFVALAAFGYWAFKRYQRLKYNRIKTKLRYQTGDGEELVEDFRSELPGGGARVVATRDPDDIESVNSRIREQAEANKPKLSINLNSPSAQADLDLGLSDEGDDPHIPVLLDPADEHSDEEVQEPLAEQEPSADHEPLADQEPIADQESLADEEPSAEQEPFTEQEPVQEVAEETADEELVEADSAPELEPEPETETETEAETEAEQPEVEKPDHSILFSAPETTEKDPFSQSKQESPASEAIEAEQPEADREPESLLEPVSSGEEEASEEPSADIEPEQAQTETPMDEVIIINLMATAEGEQFRGTDLWGALESQGLKFGNMDIFHFDSGSGSETIRFSAANILNPGTFPTEKLEYFYTPGICFFMTMTAGVSNLNTFNQLLSAARGVASKLGGELQDQDRNYLTHQSIESIRTQMGEFQRKNIQG